MDDNTRANEDLNEIIFKVSHMIDMVIHNLHSIVLLVNAFDLETDDGFARNRWLEAEAVRFIADLELWLNLQ